MGVQIHGTIIKLKLGRGEVHIGIVLTMSRSPLVMVISYSHYPIASKLSLSI